MKQYVQRLEPSAVSEVVETNVDKFNFAIKRCSWRSSAVKISPYRADNAGGARFVRAFRRLAF